MLKRDPKVQETLDNLADLLGLMPQTEAAPKQLCIHCRKIATHFKDEISAREYQITGFCQECQDWVFAEPEDEEE